MDRRPEPNRLFLTSAQFDTTKALVGGSPFAGDMGSTGIPVPPTRTVAQDERYLFQLVAATIPVGSMGIIRDLGQMVYIGASLMEEHEQPDAQWLLEVPVTDPLWCFPDGNVSWHLRTGSVGTPDTASFAEAGFTAPYSNRRDTTDSAILSLQSIGGYRPLNAGMPYGKPLAGLGTFRDLRFPWHEGSNTDLGIRVYGPTRVTLYASVYQTNPDRRPNKPVGIETAGLRQEDVFTLNYPQARYTRIGGRMKIDIVRLDDNQIRGC